jgi:hypothetical protein
MQELGVRLQNSQDLDVVERIVEGMDAHGDFWKLEWLFQVIDSWRNLRACSRSRCALDVFCADTLLDY